MLQHASSLKACCSKEVRLPKAGVRIRNDSGLLAVIKWEQLAKIVVLVLGTVPYGEGRELVHMLGPELCIVLLVVEPADAPCTAIPPNRRTFKKSHEDLLPLLNNPRNPIAIFRPSNLKTRAPHTVYSSKNCSEDAYLSARKIGSFMVPPTFQSFFCDALRLSSSCRLGSLFCCLPPSSRSSSPEWLLPSTSTSIWNHLPVVVFIR